MSTFMSPALAEFESRETAAARARVGAGAGLLDDLGPAGWYAEHYIDLDVLDINSLEMCVLGQVYSVVDGGTWPYGYGIGCSALGFTGTPAAFGFDSWSDLDAARIEAAWRQEILARREAAVSS